MDKTISHNEDSFLPQKNINDDNWSDDISIDTTIQNKFQRFQTLRPYFEEYFEDHGPNDDHISQISFSGGSIGSDVRENVREESYVHSLEDAICIQRAELRVL